MSRSLPLHSPRPYPWRGGHSWPFSRSSDSSLACLFPTHPLPRAWHPRSGSLKSQGVPGVLEEGEEEALPVSMSSWTQGPGLCHPLPSSQVWDWKPIPSAMTPISCYLWVFGKGQPSPSSVSSEPRPFPPAAFWNPDPAALPAPHRAAVKPVLVPLPILGLTWLVGVRVHLSPAWAYAAVGLNSF